MSYIEIPGIPNDLITEGQKGFRRFRVDVAQTSFFQRRQFRISYAYAAPAVLKFSSPVNFILWAQNITCNEGHVTFMAVVNPTPSGTFATPVPIFGVNRMDEYPEHIGQVTINTGGTISGGTAVETLSLKVAQASGQQSTVGDHVNSERGLPAGDYYLQFAATSGSPTGVYNIMWEERP